MISKMFLIRADAACDIYGNRGKRGPFRATGLSPIGQRLAQSLDTFSFFRKIRIDNDILKQYNKKNILPAAVTIICEEGVSAEVLTKNKRVLL